MARYDGSGGYFGGPSARGRDNADRFFDDLVGARSRGRVFESEEDDAPTLTLSSAEVLVCVGGINNATVTARTTGGGTVAWSIADPTRASITATGNTATIRGRHPGVTTVRAELTSGGRTITATARLLVTFIELALRNSGTIEPAPENEDEATETAAAGGTNVLGPLPMGTGRGDPPFAGASSISPIMVVGRIFPAESARRFTFRWQRLLTHRSWRIRRAAAGGRWTVTFRNAAGPMDDDTGSGDFNDPQPSSPGGRIYIYDNSGVFLGAETIAVGEFIHMKKDFIYRVFVRLNGVWTLCSAIHVGQVITARRTATGGTVATDWTSVENTNAIRRLSMTIAPADVRAIVGGADPIDIAAGANP
jgi:hypothetical protein